jgi:predicted phosphate transport protein (TIGR00153 family)
MAIQNPFSNLFAKSPMGPLQDHMAKAHATTEALLPFLMAAQKDKWDKCKELHKGIVKCEEEADKQKSSLRKHLPKGLFMPVSRSDLLELVGMQDEIANRAKDIAGLMLGRKMAFPESLSEHLIEYAQASINTSGAALDAIKHIDDVIEAGFGTRQVKAIEQKIVEIEKLEHRSDKLQVKLRARMFKLEKNIDPIEAMFLYRIMDWIGDISDFAEKVGNRLQILVSV